MWALGLARPLYVYIYTCMLCIYVHGMVLSAYSDFFSSSTELEVLYNREGKYFLYVTNCIFKSRTLFNQSF